MAVNSSTYGINLNQEFQSGFGTLDQNNRYTLPVEQLGRDLQDLWDVGFRKARCAVHAFNGYPPIIELQDEAATFVKDFGFETDYGVINSNPHHPSDWAPFLASAPAKAVWCQEQGFDVCALGNENATYGACAFEAFTSVARAGSVVTVTTGSAHSLKSGDLVELIGNTVLVNFVTVASTPSSTTFTVNNAGTAGTQTSGSYRYAPQTVIRVLKDLATTLKNDYSLTIPLSYSMIQGNQTGTLQEVDLWIASGGRGNFDYLDQNIYGEAAVPVSGSANFRDFCNNINRGYTAFGSAHYRVTEWNIAFNNGGVPTNPKVASDWFMARKKFLDTKPGLVHYAFCYRQTNNLLILKKPYNTYEGTYRDWWWLYTGQRPQSTEISSGVAIPISQARAQEFTYTRTSSNLEFNYGQDQQSHSFNESSVRADFTELWSLGVRKLRMNTGDYQEPAGVAAVKQAALLAKSMGFYVIFGTNGGGFGSITDENIDEYADAVYDLADWAWTNGMDEFQTGNEIEYSETSTHTLTDSVIKIKAIGTETKASHFPADGVTRFLSYAMAQSSMDYVGAPGGWIATGKGPYDLLGYNVYGDNGNYEQFVERITDLYETFGTSLYISEWNISAHYQDFPEDIGEQTALIAQKYAFLDTLPIPNFFFAYRADINDDLTPFAIRVGNEYRQWFYAMFAYTPLSRGIATGRSPAIGRSAV